jgi:hypothetical protein
MGEKEKEYWSTGVMGYKEQPILQHSNTPILQYSIEW